MDSLICMALQHIIDHLISQLVLMEKIGPFQEIILHTSKRLTVCEHSHAPSLMYYKSPMLQGMPHVPIWWILPFSAIFLSQENLEMLQLLLFLCQVPSQCEGKPIFCLLVRLCHYAING